MAVSHQEIRPSQFVTTFGPGSVVETPSGPVVLRTLDTLFDRTGRSPDEFQILDERLSQKALGGALIVGVPTNAELPVPADQPIHPSYAFPFWSLCAQHGGHQVLYRADEGCSLCSRSSGDARKEKAGREAIRFVTACDGGHLDEVPWRYLVHGADGSCKPDHYLWYGGGRALRMVRIVCPVCGAEENFGRAYGRPWRCTARRVELGESTGDGGCSRKASIVQRGSASLRNAELETAITILDAPARLHDLLANFALLTAVRTLKNVNAFNRDSFLRAVETVRLSDVDTEHLRRTSWSEILSAVDQMLGNHGTEGEDTLRSAELDRLRQAAEHGAPAASEDRNRRCGPPLFEVRRFRVRSFPGPYGDLTFRVSPVSRLRMVMVQTGYRRLDPEQGTVVPTSFQWVGNEWYPGVELFGEGIFVETVGDAPPLSDGRYESWRGRWAEQEGEDDGQPPTQPGHVWWHTLSHRLIRALSVDSGYSSAAIRERVYSSPGGGSGRGGGVLLYTVQPGGDGTLGGLVALTDHFGSILESALRDVDTCSNDPLCAEAPDAGEDGAACYSCTHLSETSCEYRNRGLDRLLLAENRP
jgi:hypothetical protein